MTKTYNDIKTELIYELTLIKDVINIMEYIDPKYFKKEFIEEIKPIVLGIEQCKCNLPYISKTKFNTIILDTILQYKEREDIQESIESIFNVTFTNTLRIN